MHSFSGATLSKGYKYKVEYGTLQHTTLMLWKKLKDLNAESVVQAHGLSYLRITLLSMLIVVVGGLRYFKVSLKNPSQWL